MNTVTHRSASKLALHALATLSLFALGAGAQTLDAALDDPGLTWTTGANGTNGVWFGQTTNTFDTIDAARSGNVGHLSTGFVQTVVMGPGTLTFRWRVSSESGFDFLEFLTNGVLVTSPARISGTGGAWSTLQTFNLPAPISYTLRWQYRKDSSDSAGQDAGYLDTVTFTGPTAPAMTNQPQSQTVQCGSTVTLTAGVSGTVPLTNQWTLNGADVPGATGLTLTLNNIQGSQAGDYAVRVCNLVGCATSMVATLTVVTNAPLTLTCPGNLLVGAVDTNGAIALFAATANNPCDPTVSVACAPASGTLFPLGSTPVTCTATNGEGSNAVCSFFVRVALCQTNLFAGAGLIPDNNAGGITNTVTISDSPIASLIDVNVLLKINGTYNGDLYVTLAHDSGLSVLLNRVGRTGGGAFGYSDDGVDVRLDDQAARGDIHIYRLTLNGSHATAITGALTNDWAPDGRATAPATVVQADPRTRLLNQFNGLNPNGQWTLFLSDLGGGDFHTNISWGLELCGDLPTAPVITNQPAGLTTNCGSTVTFTVGASGSFPRTNQWALNGVDIPGATGSSLTLTNVSPAEAGGYTVSVCNAAGCVTSVVATLSVVNTSPLTITCPSNFTATTGDPAGAIATFTATSVNPCDPSIGVTCAPASGSLFPLGFTTVTCTATNAAGSNAVCSFQVRVVQCLTNSLTLNAPIPDANGTGVVSAISVASPIGSITDVNVLLNIGGTWNGDLVALLFHESGFSVLLNRVGKRVGDDFGYADRGLDVRLDDQAANGDIHVYRTTLGSAPVGQLAGTWAPDGRNVSPGAVLDTSPRTALLSGFNSLNPNGDWFLQVVDVATGDLHTNVSWGLEICGDPPAPIVITNQPQSQTSPCSSNVTLTVAYSGTAPATNQWTRDGIDIPGATATTLVISNALLTDSATYRVRVSNMAGTMLSDQAVLAVVETTPPAIAGQPQSTTNNTGGSATFSVTAVSCGPATYSWCKGASVIPGATNSTLTVTNLQLSDAGVYTVKVSNAVATTTSDGATLTVNRPPVALDNGGSTAMNRAIAVSIIKLLNNDSDADGDPITITAVSSPTAQGGTASLGGGSVTYTPPTGFAGLDSFTYTISDGRGGTATATVQVMVVSGALPSQNQIALIPKPGGFIVRFAGIPGTTYQVQRSTDMMTWTTLANVVAPLHGIVEYEDMTLLPSAFYRTAAP